VFGEREKREEKCGRISGKGFADGFTVEWRACLKGEEVVGIAAFWMT
jgi:hypothetical protein